MGEYESYLATYNLLRLVPMALNVVTIWFDEVNKKNFEDR